jgi:hypothetical protein
VLDWSEACAERQGEQLAVRSESRNPNKIDDMLPSLSNTGIDSVWVDTSYGRAK